MKQSEKFTSIDEFEILAVPTSSKNCLGVGSFGIVKLARHKLTNKKYALKIVWIYSSLFIIYNALKIFIGQPQRIGM